MNQITTRKTMAPAISPPVLSSRTEHNLRVARNGLVGGKLLPGYGVTDDERKELRAHALRLQLFIDGGRPEEIGQAIAPLFLALTPRTDDAQGARTRIAAYVSVLSSFPVWAVRKAVDEYLRGAVGDGKWCPTAVELYKAAGRHVAPHIEKIGRITELLSAKPLEKPDKATRQEAVAKVRSEWSLGEAASQATGERE